MKHANQTRAKIERQNQTPQVIEFDAFMGNRSGTVKKDKKNNVYVMDNNGNVMVVKNLRNIPHVSKLPVVVGMDPNEPGILQVLRQRNAYHNPPYPNVAEHAEIMHARWGSDPVWVNKQQILDLLPFPASSTGMVVQLRGGKYYLNGDHILPNQTIDFSAEIPASGACWVLAEVDDAKVITLRAGATVASREVLTPEDIPAPATGQKRLFAVKCYYGQTRIVQTKTIEDIYILHDVPGEGFGNIPLLTSDPASPADGELWLLRETSGGHADGEIMGMMAMTYTSDPGTANPLKLSVNDNGTIRRIEFV